MIYAIIMAGGKGERFWPLSRTVRPKQLLKITSQKTMIEETILRMEGFIPTEQIRMIAGEDMKQRILEILPPLNPEHIYAEPFGRNTCLAIALSAILLRREDPDAIMVVLSSDHMIAPKEKLLQNLKTATEVCMENDCLITLGITPTRPDTGYGYIEEGQLFGTIDGISIYAVSEFKEKPTRIVAQQYYYDRKHLWNSGMFVWSVRSILQAIEQYQPDLWKNLEMFERAIGTPNEESAKKALYLSAENISIDYAILEKADNVLAMKADIVWDDVGSWLALDRIKVRDKDNNVLVGQVINEGTFESIVYNDSEGLIATLGVSDLIIVKTDNIVMVAHKTQINDLKKLLTELGENEKLEKYL